VPMTTKNQEPIWRNN